ncbi:MAG: hypothetical protein EA359_04895 [Balneolaceae bacterium]|nr:MAG: hypothetical protein EA359_04895 [Balneolaceae bacterium]
MVFQVFGMASPAGRTIRTVFVQNLGDVLAAYIYSFRLLNKADLLSMYYPSQDYPEADKPPHNKAWSTRSK